MFRFRVDVAVFAIFGIAVMALLGMLAVVLYKELPGMASRADVIGVAVCAAAGVLAGLAAGLQLKLPNFGGMPPPGTLARYVTPVAVVGLVAVLATAWITTVIMGRPFEYSFHSFSLEVSRLVAAGIVVRCAHSVCAIMRDFARKCQWARESW